MDPRRLLAKPDVPLFDHLREVTCLGAELAERWGLLEPLRAKALLACALHDLGKATPEFQEYISGGRRRAYPHALASLPFVLVAEGGLNKAHGWEGGRLEATGAVLTHHSPLGPRLYQGYERFPDYSEELFQLWEALGALLAEQGVTGLPSARELWTRVQPLLREAPSALLDEPLAFEGERRSLRGVLRGLRTEDFALVKAVLHLADWLVSAPTKRSVATLFLEGGATAIVRHIRRFALRSFQRRAHALSHSEGLRLRAPTGTGKTEALLLWAGETDRLLYLLPTQATTNAMWRRLRRIYGDEAVGLAHGRAAYVLHRAAEEDGLGDELRDEKLLGSIFAKPITVATLDQYLLAHLHGRHWEERRSLARRATVVIDEVHAYEPYTLGMLLEALERERPARLALASATLPDLLLALFPLPGEHVEAEEALWERRRHTLELRPGSLLEEGVEMARRWAREGRRVLIVANTVRDAQRIYRRLREACGRAGLLLLHARFALRDRQAREEQLESPTPRPGTILVATQVVEVSLDISYDALLTEVAPIDALVQRLGRVNRRGERPPERIPCWIFTASSEGSRRVYGQEVLERSLELLEGLPERPTEAHWAEVTHKLYKHVMATDQWRAELEEGRRTLSELQRDLGCYTIDLSEEEMRSRFTARRGHLPIDVLPHPFVEEALALRERGDGLRWVELLVPVPIGWLHAYAEHFHFSHDLGCFLTDLPYDPELGLLAPDPFPNAAEGEAQFGLEAEVW